MNQKPSLLFQLCSMLALAITFATLLSSWLSLRDAEEQVAELFDAEMAQLARVIEGLVLSEEQSSQRRSLDAIPYLDEVLDKQSFQNKEYSAFGHEYERKLALQVWNEEGKLILDNKQLAGDSEIGIRGYSYLNEGEHSWRTFTIIGNHLSIRVAQRDDVRNELTWTIGWHAIMPQLVINAILLFFIFLIIRKSITPLSLLSQELAKRNSENLEPVSNNGDTLEIYKLEEEINKLFKRVRDSYERERQFTADAAHELRTPLAAANIHLENIKSIAKDPQVQSFSSKAEASIRRLRHLVEQLLTLRRMDNKQSHDTAIVNIASTATQIVEELTAETAAQEVVISNELRRGEHALVRINELELDILLRNLIDNALKYRDCDTLVEIHVDAHSLSIFNECDPIEEHMIEPLFQRFHRGQVEQRQGSGLGLAICEAVCERNKIDLSFYNQVRQQRYGIEVMVCWPAIEYAEENKL